MAFRCTVVTPEEQTLDEQATQVILPAYDGLLGILTDRAPLLAKLGVGPLRIDLPNGQKRFFLIDGGIAQMKDNKLTILTERAIPANEIDAEAAQAEYAEAVARRITDEKSFNDRDREIRRAQAKQQMAKAR